MEGFKKGDISASMEQNSVSRCCKFQILFKIVHARDRIMRLFGSSLIRQQRSRRLILICATRFLCEAMRFLYSFCSCGVIRSLIFLERIWYKSTGCFRLLTLPKSSCRASSRQLNKAPFHSRVHQFKAPSNHERFLFNKRNTRCW